MYQTCCNISLNSIFLKLFTHTQSTFADARRVYCSYSLTYLKWIAYIHALHSTDICQNCGTVLHFALYFGFVDGALLLVLPDIWGYLCTHKMMYIISRLKFLWFQRCSLFFALWVKVWGCGVNLLPIDTWIRNSPMTMLLYILLWSRFSI